MALFKSITIGQYIPGNSTIHRLDPRTKIIGTVLLIVLLFMVDTFWGYALAALAIAAIVHLSEIPPRLVLRGLRPLFVILLLTVSLHLFMTEGDPIFRFWIVEVTWQGLSRGIMMGVRLALLVMGTSLLTLTTSPINLTDGIEGLLKPGKRIGIPAHELAMMMTIALRFIPTLLDETDRIIKSQMARGADFYKGGLYSRMKSLIPILVPLFVGSFRRADELAIAMEARCYRGGVGRTRMNVLKMGTKDYLAMLGALLVIVLTKVVI